MEYTNVNDLPLPLAWAVMNDPYAPTSDFTVTGLLKPARITALEREHKDDLVEDVSDRIWALMGQIGHLVLERSGIDNYVERRHTITRDGYTISGQVDLWLNKDPVEATEGTLVDYKFTSIWAAKDGLKPEWEQQCNLNALLCRENGISVTKAEVVAIFRDWSVGEARRNSDYPQKQVMRLPVPVWPAEKQETFLKERMAAHLAAREVLPLCTALERWAKLPKWAIKKMGATKATRLFDNENDATDALMTFGSKYEMEYRPPVQTRCLDYCSVSKWCEQFKALDPKGWEAAQ